MGAGDKRDKTKGIIGTILFHSLLIILFLFMGLTYRIPPPPEEGISINFGYMDEGKTNKEPEDKSVIPEPVSNEIIEEQNTSVKEIITQQNNKLPAIEKDRRENKDPKPEKKEVIEKPKSKVNNKALYTGKKKNQAVNEGDKNKNGNQGVIDGVVNSKVYDGGGTGIDGIAYQLGGRNPEFKAQPVYKIQEEGTVVVIINVDRYGSVISAIPGAKGSTTLNKYLLARAKEAALKTKFNPKESAPENQQGKIIYHFSLN